MYQYPNYMYHYGVKGMKWGVRKSRVKSSTSKKRGKSTYSSDYLETAELRKKSYKQLSNEELRALNKRMNLESEYQRLNPSKVSKGKKVVKGIVAAGGTAASIYALRKNPVVQIGISAINLKLRNQKQLPGW